MLVALLLACTRDPVKPDTATDAAPPCSAAPEVCNGRDDDCDGETDEAGAAGESEWFADRDGDTWGDGDASTTACEAPSGSVERAGDCDDEDASRHPEATDASCDGVDDDCDGDVDEEAPWVDVYIDADADGHGDPAAPLATCAPGAGTSPIGDDCDDSNPTRHPEAGDATCDGFDDNCSGEADEDAPWTEVYADADADGHGDPAVALTTCAPGAGTTTTGDDCDDADPERAPGFVDPTGDGRDQDCVDGAPSLTGVAIDPAEADRTTPLVCRPAGWADPEELVGTIAIRWEVDGIEVATGELLASDSAPRGSVVTCRATPWDSTQAGAELASAGMVIGDAAPSVTVDGTTTVSEGATLALTIAATDPDGDEATLEVTGPAGSTWDGDALRWTPSYEEAGIWTLTVTARALDLTTVVTLPLIVTDASRPPTIATDCEPSASVGSTYACAMSAQDPEGASVTWVVTSGPSGLTIDPATGAVRWTPAATDGGSQAFTVTATDADGGVGELTVPLTVEAISPVAAGSVPARGDLTLTGGHPVAGIASVTLTIPEGALPPGTTVTVDGIEGTHNTPPGTAGLSIEAGETLAAPATLTFTWEDGFLDDLGTSDISELGVAWADDDGVWQPLDGVVIDEAARTATATLPHFSRWGLVSIPTLPGYQAEGVYRYIDGALALQAGEPLSAGAVNCLIVHGMRSTAADFTPSGDNLGKMLEAACDDVLYYQYPWARSIDYLGARLGATLAPYVGDADVYVFAHSMGGLVTRSMLQLHPDDTTAPRVTGVTTLASPGHGGSPTGVGALVLAGLESSWLGDLAWTLLPGIHDLLVDTYDEPGAFLTRLESAAGEGDFQRACFAAVDPNYRTWVGEDTDGLVTVSSALAMCTDAHREGVGSDRTLPIEFAYPDDRLAYAAGTVFQAHGDIVDHAQTNGVLDQLVAWGFLPTLTDDDGDGVSELDGDCDDTDSLASPDIPEACNGHDDDCDGETDGGDAWDAGTWSPDLDGDGLGAARGGVTTCDAPDGYVENQSDEDDHDADNDGVTDAAFGGDDCDAADSTIGGPTPETCDDGTDEDCDGAVDCEDEDCATANPCLPVEDRDVDGDGVTPAEGDCDDADPGVSGSHAEVPSNGVDDDCDDEVDEDPLVTAWFGTQDTYALPGRTWLVDAEGHEWVLAWDGGTTAVNPSTSVLLFDAAGENRRVEPPRPTGDGPCVLASVDPLTMVCAIDRVELVSLAYDADTDTWSAETPIATSATVLALDAEPDPAGALDVVACRADGGVTVYREASGAWEPTSPGVWCNGEIALTHGGDGAIHVATTIGNRLTLARAAPGSSVWSTHDPGVTAQVVAAASFEGAPRWYASAGTSGALVEWDGAASTITWLDLADNAMGPGEVFVPTADGGCAVYGTGDTLAEVCTDGSARVLAGAPLAGPAAAGLLADGTLAVLWNDLEGAELRLGHDDGSWTEAVIGEFGGSRAVAADSDGKVAWLRSDTFGSASMRLYVEGDAGVLAEEGTVALRTDALRDGLLAYTSDTTLTLVLATLSPEGAVAATTRLAPWTLACGGIDPPIALGPVESLAAPTWSSCSYGGESYRSVYSAASDGSSTLLAGPLSGAPAWSGVDRGGVVTLALQSGGEIVVTEGGAELARWTGTLVEILADPVDSSLVAVYTREAATWARRVETGVEARVDDQLTAVDAEVDVGGTVQVAGVDTAGALHLDSGVPEGDWTLRVADVGPVGSLDLALSPAPTVWFTDGDGVRSAMW